MIRFPETAEREWRIVAEKASASLRAKQRLGRDTLVENELERLRIRHEAQILFQQELDAENTPSLELTTLDAYRRTPHAAPVDLIDGVVKDGGLTVVLGPSGSGKSTVALQMVHSMLTGKNWLGQRATRLKGGVGLLSYDMDAGMLFDWMDGMPGLQADRIHALNAYRQGNPLGVPAMRSEIVKRWKDAKVDIVVLDSFSASFFGHDQNDAAATMAHYRDMKRFALTEVGARVLIVIVHSTESSPLKARGSTVHKDTSDTTVGVVSSATGKRTISVPKYRAARGQQEMSPVIVSAPDAVTHLVSVDVTEMNLAGLPLPASEVAGRFPEMPEAIETPNTEREEGDDED